MIVAPLAMAENDSHPDIVVMNQYREDAQVFLSTGKTSSVQFAFNDYDFLVRGSFHEGNFISYVAPSGASASMGCTINKNTIEHRCQSKDIVNNGHIRYSHDGAVIHVIPLSSENDAEGSAKVIVCTEQGKDKRGYVNTRSSVMLIQIRNKDVQIVNYWQGNVLSSEVLESIT